tara:strand:- start:7597 stop:8319 length:723 start_codon:yes stop_codon:yes gene_type:complete
MKKDKDMNIKKSKIALLIGASLFLTMPLSSTFADQKQHQTHEMQMGNTMQNIKDELRGYVKAVKSDDTQTMQQHVDSLLKLTTMPAMDHSAMNHSQMPMDHTGMTDEAIAAMGHSKMGHATMDHSNMPMDHTGMTDEAIAAMDHSNMPMDHTGMTDEAIATMDHSTMKMGHSDMKMDHANMGHDMSNMKGMSAEQHQHMMYMQEMTQFHDLFKSLDKVTDKAEISATLGKIKEQIKNSKG